MVTEKRLIDAHKIRYVWMVDDDGEWHDGVTLQSIIDKMPTVDAVEIVHGRWETHNQVDSAFCCSVCKLNVSDIEKRWLNFCPSCGAKMEGGYDDR